MDRPETRPRAYVCSPFSGDLGRSCDIARAVCRALITRGFAPFAPHLVYPWLGLEDSITEQREAAIACGLAWVSGSDVLVAWIRDGVSNGMKSEIEAAIATDIPFVQVFNIEDINKLDATSYGPTRNKRQGRKRHA